MRSPGRESLRGSSVIFEGSPQKLVIEAPDLAVEVPQKVVGWPRGMTKSPDKVLTDRGF
jgi:hypothetical protein